jgi:hypothetical protein
MNFGRDTSRSTGRGRLSAVGCKRPSAGNGRPSEVIGTGCRGMPFGMEDDGSPDKIGGETSKGWEKETQGQV